MMLKKSSAMLAALFVLSGCSSLSQQHADIQGSGFLTSYRQMQEVDVDVDGELYRYRNPAYNIDTYQQLMLDPIVYFPKQGERDLANDAEINAIVSYTNKRLLLAAESSGQFVTTPGPGVAKLRLAVTSVEVVDQGLKPRQYIPIAYLISAAMGNLEHPALEITLEGELIDSQTNEVMSRMVFTAVGEELESEFAILDIRSVKPIVDQWERQLVSALYARTEQQS